ncbi:MAG: polysaccharide biosynthesis tyrosine autokinase [Dehalococcoidia bacterium]|nr:polysaccharide biosynthesis tyrosine autokinase [Dehalococcoidia bacterium]
MNMPTAWTLARRWGWLLLLATVVGGLSAVMLSRSATPTYQATTTLLVSQQGQDGVLQPQDLQISSLLTTALTELITVRPVMERAAADPRLDMSPGEVAGSLEVEQAGGQLLRLTATHGDPVVAANLANVVVEAFMSSTEAGLGQIAPAVSVLEAAAVPSAPADTGSMMSGMLGALLGFSLCLGLVVLYEYLDRSVSRPQQVYDLTGLPTVAMLPDAGRTKQHVDYLAVAAQPKSRAAEEYRAARTNLKHVLLPREDDSLERQVITFTSAGEGEGKTTSVANLALVFGLAGYRTLVVDADLRRPALHEVFALDNREGLTSVLRSERTAAGQGVQETMHTGVSVLPSGPLSLLGAGAQQANPADLLDSSRMRSLLQAFREEYDVILVDTPPAREASDASVVASLSDALVLVLRSGRTSPEHLGEAVERLASSGCPIVGVILNRVRGRQAGGHVYGPSPTRASIVSLPAAVRPEAARESPRAEGRRRPPLPAVEEPRS